jgi:hypothetical protein
MTETLKDNFMLVGSPVGDHSGNSLEHSINEVNLNSSNNLNQDGELNQSNNLNKNISITKLNENNNSNRRNSNNNFTLIKSSVNSSQIGLKKQSGIFNISELTKTIMREEEDVPIEEELKFIEEFLIKETQQENEYETSEYFKRIEVDEVVSFILAAIAVGSGMLYHEFKSNGKKYTKDEDLLNFAIYTSLNVVTANVFLFCKYIFFVVIFENFI